MGTKYKNGKLRININNIKGKTTKLLLLRIKDKEENTIDNTKRYSKDWKKKKKKEKIKNKTFETTQIHWSIDGFEGWIMSIKKVKNDD